MARNKKTSASDAPARSTDALRARIDAAYDALSPQLRRAARYLRRHLTEVALYPLRAMAERAEVSPATMSRLTVKLGFASYEELQERVRGLVVSGTERYAQSASGLAAFQGASGLSRLVAQHVDLVQANVQRAFADAPAKTIEAIVERLARARRIYILGLRSNYSAAFYFHYVLRAFRDNAILLEDRMGMLIDELGGIGGDDALVAISYEPYAIEAAKAVEYAAAAGCTVIALTDTPFSPIARPAKHTLLLPTRTTSYYQSLIPTIAILEALVSLLIVRTGPAAVKRIGAEFRRRERFGVYWQGDK
jgi:DNA-binding MurR/RpiR family transcriptional regulator